MQIETHIDPKTEEKRNRLLEAISKREVKGLESALEEFETFFKSNKLDPKEIQLISLARTQIEQLKVRDRMNFFLFKIHSSFKWVRVGGTCSEMEKSTTQGK